MAHFHNNALIGASGQGGYQIERSLRFNSADSAYLNRTPASAGNRRKFTCSAWVKRTGILASLIDVPLLSAGDGTNFGISGTGALGATYEGRFYIRNGGANLCKIPNALFRDPSAWYHFVFVVDTENATAADRQILYVNGARQENFDGSFTQNTDTNINTTTVHTIGVGIVTTANSGYSGNFLLAEYHFIDGQALTPSSFGETDTITGVWKPKRYAGTYGTNGFYLKFADNSGTTSTTLGKDSSGNSNNWTPNNFSVTAGAGNDSMIDTPTPYADGGNGRGNYATLNPLRLVGSNGSLTNGNLENSGGGNPARAFPSTIAVLTGKFYAEFTPASNNYAQVGAVDSTLFPYSSGAVRGSGAITWELSTPSSVYYVNSTSGSGSPPSPAGGDVIMVAIDATTRKVWFGRNGTWNGSGDPAAGTNEIGTLSGTDAISFFVRAESTTITANFGQRAFAHTPPSGFLALNTQNLPEPSIKKPSSYMDTLLYTGNGSTQTISGLGFSPDLVWVKGRSAGTWNHILTDSVRGNGASLISNTTGSEGTRGATLTSTGFTFTYPNEGGDANYNGTTYVAWCWDESATPGFDIVTYTGNGTARTIAHSLGVAPSMMIVKNRTSAGNGWPVYHQSANASPATGGLRLNLTDAFVTYSPYWNNTAPTSSVFTVGTDSQVNGNTHEMVAYLWSEVAGFSKFGSYTGNGSTDGPFVFCGFRPKFVMFKCSSSSESGNADWHIQDSSRNASNISTGSNRLFANLSAAESSNAEYKTDFLSNGFKLRTDGVNYGQNNNGNTYIFAAFAETAFRYSLAR